MESLRPERKADFKRILFSGLVPGNLNTSARLNSPSTSGKVVKREMMSRKTYVTKARVKGIVKALFTSTKNERIGGKTIPTIIVPALIFALMSSLRSGNILAAMTSTGAKAVPKTKPARRPKMNCPSINLVPKTSSRETKTT